MTPCCGRRFAGEGARATKIVMVHARPAWALDALRHWLSLVPGVGQLLLWPTFYSGFLAQEQAAGLRGCVYYCGYSTQNLRRRHSVAAMGSLSPAVSSAALVCIHPLIFPFEAAGNNRRRTAPKATSQARRGRLRTAPRNRVLIVGKIRELALYRAEVLRAHGFAATISQSETEARTAIRGGDFDVVVLSYTLSNDAVEEVT